MNPPQYLGPCFTGETRGMSKHVPLPDVRARELVVHVPGRGFVGEAVPGAGGYLVHAPFDRGQENHIVQVVYGGRSGEVGKKPWAEHSVVHSVVATGDEAPGGSSRGTRDHLILVVSGGQPRGNGVLGEELKKSIACDEHAPAEAVGQSACDRRLPGTGRPRHDDKRSHAQRLFRSPRAATGRNPMRAPRRTSHNDVDAAPAEAGRTEDARVTGRMAGPER